MKSLTITLVLLATIMCGVLSKNAYIAKNAYTVDLSDPFTLKRTKTQAVLLKIGDKLTLELDENPTTGYTWVYRDPATLCNPIFKVVNDTYVQDP